MRAGEYAGAVMSEVVSEITKEGATQYGGEHRQLSVPFRAPAFDEPCLRVRDELPVQEAFSTGRWYGDDEGLSGLRLTASRPNRIVSLPAIPRQKRAWREPETPRWIDLPKRPPQARGLVGL
jgi:hypothetical protein